MDVSNQPDNENFADVSTNVPTGVPGGTELIQTVVELTRLPETWVHRELGRIIENAGHSSGTLTLEQLREAMLAYLESLQNDLDGSDAPAPGPIPTLAEASRQNLALVSE